MTNFFRLSRWRAGHLLLGWCGYWLALVLALVGSAIPAITRVSKLPEGMGSASTSFGSEGLQMSIREGSSVLWSLDVGFVTLMLLIGIPPLVLWVLWLRVHKREPLGTETNSRV